MLVSGINPIAAEVTYAPIAEGIELMLDSSPSDETAVPSARRQRNHYSPATNLIPLPGGQ